MTTRFSLSQIYSLRPYLLKAFYNWSKQEGFIVQLTFIVDKTLRRKLSKVIPLAGVSSVALDVNTVAVEQFKIDEHAVSLRVPALGQEDYLSIPMHAIEMVSLKDEPLVCLVFDHQTQDELSSPDYYQDLVDLENGDLKWFDYAQKDKQTSDQIVREIVSSYQKNENLGNSKIQKPKHLRPINRSDLRFL